MLSVTAYLGLATFTATGHLDGDEDVLGVLSQGEGSVGRRSEREV